MQSVKGAFDHATAMKTHLSWNAAGVIAGDAAVRMALDGDMFMAAQMDGVSEEARRQAIALQPKRTAA